MTEDPIRPPAQPIEELASLIELECQRLGLSIPPGTAPGLAASPRSHSTNGRSAGSELAIAGCTMVFKQHAW